MSPKLNSKERSALVARYRKSNGTTSLRQIAKEYGVSPATVSKILKAHNITPRRLTAQRNVKGIPPEEAGSRPIRLSDIAAAAGVSVSTASRALKDNKMIPPATCARIKDIAKEMGYKVHPHISTTMTAIRKGKFRPITEVLAYLYCTYYPKPGWKKDLKLPYGPVRKFEAAQKTALEHGYKVEPFDFIPNAKEAKQLEKILYARGIRGLILDIPAYYTETTEFRFDRFSSVTFRDQWNLKTHIAGHNNFQNTLIQFTQLWKLGYRKIGMLSSDAKSTSTQFQADAGYRHCQYHLVPSEYRIPILHYDTLCSHLLNYKISGKDYSENKIDSEKVEIPVFDNRVEETDWLWKQDWSSLRNSSSNSGDDYETCLMNLLGRWLKEFEPEVLICDDMRTLGWLEQVGHNPPQSISIAHNNLNLEVEGWSGIRRADEEIASAAIERLVDQIQQPKTREIRPIVQRFTGTWVDGKTTQRISRPLIPMTTEAENWIRHIQTSG